MSGRGCGIEESSPPKPPVSMCVSTTVSASEKVKKQLIFKERMHTSYDEIRGVIWVLFLRRFIGVKICNSRRDRKYIPPFECKLRQLYALQSRRGIHAHFRMSCAGATRRRSRVQFLHQFPKFPRYKIRRSGAPKVLTYVFKISLRRGLFDARTTRFPFNLSMPGVFSACLRTGWCSGAMIGDRYYEVWRTAAIFKQSG